MTKLGAVLPKPPPDRSEVTALARRAVELIFSDQKCPSEVAVRQQHYAEIFDASIRDDYMCALGCRSAA